MKSNSEEKEHLSLLVPATDFHVCVCFVLKQLYSPTSSWSIYTWFDTKETGPYTTFPCDNMGLSVKFNIILFEFVAQAMPEG